MNNKMGAGNPVIPSNRPSQFIRLNPQPFEEIYELGELLGMSQIGDVYNATHRNSKISYGVKIVNEEDKERHEIVERILQIFIDSDHPGLVKFNEFFREGKKIYLVMEKCTGGSLGTLLEENRKVEEYTASVICKRLFSVVYHLHENKISHRSIRPEFILFQTPAAYSDVKLVFLTQAKSFAENIRFDDQIGFDEYNSPEMMKRDYNQLCDLWSIGILLYKMLSGNFPFPNTNQNSPERNSHHIEDLPRSRLQYSQCLFDDAIWSSISNDAKDLIKGLLCSEPERLSAEDALRHPWIFNQDNFRMPPQEIITQILNDISNYNGRNNYQDAITSLTVSILTEDEIQNTRKLFLCLDKDGDGKLSLTEFMNGFGTPLNKRDHEKRISRIMEQINRNKNKFIDYHKFVKASLGRDLVLSDRNLRALFGKIDLNHRGGVNLEDFTRTFNPRNEGPTLDWNRFIKDADRDKDQMLNFAEFVAGVQREFQN